MSKIDFDYSQMVDHYGGINTDREGLIAEMKAIKVVISVDGISKAEEMAMRAALNVFHIPKDMQDEALAFDPTGVKVEDVLPQFEKGGTRARWLLYNAVLIASVDGFSDREREVFQRAGEALGVDPDTVAALEELVILEGSVKRLRHSLFGVRGGPKIYSSPG